MNLTVAAMHNGAHLPDVSNHATASIVAGGSYTRHTSMAYGIDWCHSDPSMGMAMGMGGRGEWRRRGRGRWRGRCRGVAVETTGGELLVLRQRPAHVAHKLSLGRLGAKNGASKTEPDRS